MNTDGAFPVEHFNDAQKEIEAFRRRQSEDMQRRNLNSSFQRRKKFHERYAQVVDVEYDLPIEDSFSQSSLPTEGEEAWRNAEGERLRDFGVDEEVEFYDEDNFPLAKLIERRNNSRNDRLY
jgi:palmitoyltransferase